MREKLLVGLYLSLMTILALHYNVIVIDFDALHRYTWPIIESLTQVVGTCLVTMLLSKSKNSNSSL